MSSLPVAAPRVPLPIPDGQLASLAASTAHWIILLDVSRHILWANEAFLRGVGRTAEDLVGRLLRETFSAGLNPPAEIARIGRCLDVGEGVRSELLLRGSHGVSVWVDIDFQPIRDDQGSLSGFVVAALDVTERRTQRQLLEMAVAGAGLGSWYWDVQSDSMECNDRLLAILGYERGDIEMTGQGWFSQIHPDDAETWSTAIRAHLKNSVAPVRQEVRLKCSDGHWRWLLFTGAIVTRGLTGDPHRMAGVCIDIHAQKVLEEQLRQAARTDNLTQLPNRRVVLEKIASSIARGRAASGYHFAVLFMDFDRFKQVNDTLGHSVGDELLRQIAQRLEVSLRPGDTFIRSSDYNQMAARIGGDEFVVLLDDIRGDLDAQLVADRLLDVLARPYQIGSNKVSSTVSIGIVTTEHAAQDADGVLRDADIAMYEAKRAGRGRYVMFEPSMRKRARDDVALENDLRQALDDGELFVVYQPLVDLTSGGLTGLEALVRWRHPQRGLVSPVEFIPVAEASGLIGRIGHFVLEAACREFAMLLALPDTPATLTMAVNLSRAQLRQPGLASDVLDVLRTHGVNASQLILEVTESLAAQDEVVQATLADIRSLGVMLSLDDFGTGYSSLSCLHELPVNIVKVDRSFVIQAQTSAYHRVLIEATIRMANTLGLGTVAEGIETSEQAALMKVLGCDKGQGYLYSKPLDAQALMQWMKTHVQAFA